MEEKCKECSRPLNEYSKTCLKCHCSYCYYCEDKHTTDNSGHSFRFPILNTYSYTYNCMQHLTVGNDQYCQDCSALICRICVNTQHKGHITRPIDQLANEQNQEVASEIQRIVKSNKKVQTQLDARERNLDQLIKKANDIEFDLDQECKRINELILEKRLYLKSFVKSQQNKDFCAFLSDINSLKSAIRINKELEKTLERLLEETKNNNSGFLTGYADFRKYSAMLVTYPKTVGDEFLSMEIDYQKSTDEEIKKMLPRICIGLSQVAGAKLTAGNSSIADLGDKYRPTRISDMFAEMYDSDWTDVMDNIIESHKEWTEKLVVRHIFIVLQECFHASKRIATEQMKRLCEDMFLSASTQDLSNYVETHVTEIKQLQDARKGTAPFVGKMLKERVFDDSTFRQNCRRNKGINMSLVSQITASEFGQQCVNICWFMVVQDPEMYIDGDLQPGIQFDRDVYKEYTRSGKRVAFSVWPALYLHEGGPLLSKGVAQACD